MHAVADMAIALQNGLSRQDRFQKLIGSVRRLLGGDASALLRYENLLFRPLAIDGLSADVLGRRFSLSAHPRLEAIARAGDVVRFPADSLLPDPYDGLIPGHEELKVHACIGLPLFADQELIGALTLDSLNPAQFDDFSDEELRLIGALASSALNNALLMDALEKQALPVMRGGYGTPQAVGHNEEETIGLSPVMLRLKQEIGIVADSGLNVLITGETGVGKELVANAVHAQSSRRAQKLVYLNCAALPESVAESELFGHVKGAFTGAIHHRIGKFEMADGGTLFLDEIGDLSLVLQAKLLRAIQYGDIQRVGDDTTHRVDVRILAATNRDLKSAVVAGRFRLDLFHRLSVFPLVVPPLRERGQDVVLLAGFFAEQIKARLGVTQLSIADDTLALLQRYRWPGNVRELRHAIERAAILARASQNSSDVVLRRELFDLPDAESLRETPAAADEDNADEQDLQLATQAFQRRLIRRELRRHEMNWSASARALGLDAANLHRLAKRLGMK